MDQCGNGAGQATLHIAGTAAIEFIVAHNRPKRCDVCVPAIAQGDGIHVADVDEPRLVARARHGNHKVAAPGEHFELLNPRSIERRTIKLCQLLLNEPLNEVLNLALICAGVRAVNLYKVLSKPPDKVLINHMQPHNQSAFQTDCKPPERSATWAWQYLPFAGRASAFAVRAGSQATQRVRTLHGRHAVRHICLSVSPDTSTGLGNNAGPARFCGRSAQGAPM